jgi:thiol-disulfide isomerase/thioredoxin
MLMFLPLVLSGLFTCAAADDGALKVGDPAPPLKISKWVRGTPVTLGEGKDKNIYVVEFWATWCPPCIQTIPHLSKLATRFADKNVVFIGVSIDGAETAAKVEPFVKRMGKRMSYSVAMDDGTTTGDAYLLGAKVQGIPHAFVIDRDGKIAWHDHPMNGLDLKLAEMVGDQTFAESLKKVKDLQTKLQEQLEKEQWDDALASSDQLMALDPDPGLAFLKYQLLALEKKDVDATAKWGAEIVKTIEDPDALGEFAWVLMTSEDFAQARDAKLALAAAKRANELAESKSWNVLDTYARALSENGNKSEARTMEQKAIEVAKAEDAGPEVLQALEEAMKGFQEEAPAEKKEG